MSASTNNDNNDGRISISAENVENAHRRDFDLLKQSTDQLELVTNSLESLAEAKPWSAAGYFDAAQHNEMEHLYFRFMVSRQVLASLALQDLPEEQQEKAADSKYNYKYKTIIGEVKAKYDLTKSELKAKIEEAKMKYVRSESQGTDESSSIIADADAGEDAEPDSDVGANTDNEEDEIDDENNGTDSRTIATLISLAASLSLFIYESRLVTAFQNDKVAVDKLNEGFYRSDIERDTFRSLSLECKDTTGGGRIESLEHAYACYCDNKTAHDDEYDNDPAIKELAERIPILYKQTQKIIEDLFGGKSSSLFQTHLLSLENKIQQTKLAEKAHQVKTKTIDKLHEVRAHTYKGVSRLKSPTAYLIRFTEEQKRDVLNRIQPGDLVFTYTAGYMSSVFIPGVFKHGITYVGSPAQRAAVGLTEESLAKRKNFLPDGETTKLLEQFQVSTIELVQEQQDNDGRSYGKKKKKGQQQQQQRQSEPVVMDADCIEAVAEGVIFSNLCHLMDTHVNRLLVLRPKIKSEERTDALIDIFRYLGAKYDFGFNFADSSAVVCTEIIYHAFNGKGQLRFELVEHTGHLSLSADDIVNYYLDSRRRKERDHERDDDDDDDDDTNRSKSVFEFVLLATENCNKDDLNPNSNPDESTAATTATTATTTHTDQPKLLHDAKIQTGEEGINALVSLMAAASIIK